MKSDRFKMTNGDTLEVSYDGTMWQAPSCGAQRPTPFRRSRRGRARSRNAAMQMELAEYLRASGEHVPVGSEDTIDLAAHGEWAD